MTRETIGDLIALRIREAQRRAREGTDIVTIAQATAEGRALLDVLKLLLTQPEPAEPEPDR